MKLDIFIAWKGVESKGGGVKGRGKAPRANTWSDKAALRQRWFLPLKTLR
jgi:hypothetical protein